MSVWPCLFLLAFATVSQASPDLGLNAQWDVWKTKHHKVYASQREEVQRRLIWEENVKEVKKHNQESSEGLHTFNVGVNHIADMTVEEVNSMLNGLKDEDLPYRANWTFMPPSGATLPERVDWTKKGMVSPVRNQGLCGSCWAFSTVGALEGLMKRRTGMLIPLSPQNLMDCSTIYGNHGCKGGYLSESFIYVIHNKGIDSESSYPYEEKEDKCRYSFAGRTGYCTGFRILPRGNEKALQQTIANVGPVSVGINAKLASFHLYKGGIYNASNCSSKTNNHAVLVVGYGTEKGQDYWLVKNSWGTAWGEKGFVRVARNKNNLCGITNVAIFPTL